MEAVEREREIRYEFGARDKKEEEDDSVYARKRSAKDLFFLMAPSLGKSKPPKLHRR
jgi:hypothetical protein